MTTYLVPSCTKCATQFTARDAIPFMGQVAILLECDYWHQAVEIVPVSRFVMTIPEMVEEMLTVLDEMGDTMAEIKTAWQG